MSFIFASYNDYGIVMSADRRLTGYNSNGEEYILSSNNCRKLFLSRQGFALTYTGCSSVNGAPIQAKIEEFWELGNLPASLFASFAQFVNTMAGYCRENIIFLAAGYENGMPKIYTATTTQPQVQDIGELAYSGADDIAEAVLNVAPVVYDTMTLQDRIDFHRFITGTVAKYQYYSNCLQTVSEACDIVAISKAGVVFKQFNELH